MPCLTWLQASSRQGKGLLNFNSAIEEVSHQRQQSRAPQRSLHDKFVGRSRLHDCPFCIVLYRIAMLFEIDSLVPATFPARIIFFSNSTMRRGSKNCILHWSWPEGVCLWWCEVAGKLSTLFQGAALQPSSQSKEVKANNDGAAKILAELKTSKNRSKVLQEHLICSWKCRMMVHFNLTLVLHVLV